MDSVKNLSCREEPEYNHLVIVGNGLDLHLKLNTAYSDFKKFLQAHNVGENYKLFDFIYTNLSEVSESDLWSRFEDCLAEIYNDRVTTIWGNDGESWNDAKSILNTTIDFVYSMFKKWIKEENDRIPSDLVLNLGCNNCYINFNYTHTLQKCFNVNEYDIMFIHGNVSDMDNIIIGHDRYNEFGHEIFAIADMWFLEDSYLSIKASLLEILLKTDKKINTNLSKLEKWLSSNKKFDFKNIDTIYILGHSLGQTDKKYFDFLRQTLGGNCIWKISYRDSEDRTKKGQIVNDYNITNYQLMTINSLLEELKA